MIGKESCSSENLKKGRTPFFHGVCAALAVMSATLILYVDKSDGTPFRDAGSLARAVVSPAPQGWELRSFRQQGKMDPRDVFLYYTKGEKTSSTVASTMIAQAYEDAGLAVNTRRGQLLAAAPGLYASVSHSEFTEERLRQLRKVVPKPILLVVSIREGSDWVISNGYRAERMNNKNITSCDTVNFKDSTCYKYGTYLPGKESDVKAWWVLRHEHIVEDTCEMLQALNLECPHTAISQRSRSELEATIQCPVPDLSQEIQCINKLNDLTKERAAQHH